MPLKPRQAVRSTMSINDIRAAAWNSMQGSSESYERLQAENRHLAKIANQRLRSLRKAELDMFAYDRAITYLQNNDRSTFSLSLAPSTDYKGMVTQLEELTTFINAKTSTVAGARKYLDEKLEKISEFTGTTYSEDQKRKLGRLLGTDTVSALLRDVRGDSGEVIEALEELSLTDIDAQEITSIIDKYLVPYIPWADAPWQVNSNRDSLNYDELMDEIHRLYET